MLMLFLPLFICSPRNGRKCMHNQSKFASFLLYSTRIQSDDVWKIKIKYEFRLFDCLTKKRIIQINNEWLCGKESKKGMATTDKEGGWRHIRLQVVCENPKKWAAMCIFIFNWGVHLVRCCYHHNEPHRFSSWRYDISINRCHQMPQNIFIAIAIAYTHNAIAIMIHAITVIYTQMRKCDMCV